MSEIHRPIPGTLSETSLDLPRDLPFSEWMRVGETLKRMTKSIQWWTGDWLAFGEGAYGEEAFQALERADKTLANWASVCRGIEPSRRRENIDFSKHAEVAPLEPDAQERVLDRIEAEDATVGRAREMVREEQGKETQKNVEVIHQWVCNECGAINDMASTQTRAVEG